MRRRTLHQPAGAGGAAGTGRTGRAEGAHLERAPLPSRGAAAGGRLRELGGGVRGGSLCRAAAVSLNTQCYGKHVRPQHVRRAMSTAVLCTIPQLCCA